MKTGSVGFLLKQLRCFGESSEQLIWMDTLFLAHVKQSSLNGPLIVITRWMIRKRYCSDSAAMFLECSLGVPVSCMRFLLRSLCSYHSCNLLTVAGERFSGVGFGEDPPTQCENSDNDSQKKDRKKDSRTDRQYLMLRAEFSIPKSAFNVTFIGSWGEVKL